MTVLAKFSIIRYVPEQHREEFINIGLVFHCPEEKYSNIRFTTNYSRVKAFDDELDIEFLKIVLDGMKEDFMRTSTISGPTEKELSTIDFLEKATVFYVNQIQFSSIKTIVSENILEDEKNLFNTYVYFDVKRNKRIDKEKVRSLMGRVFSKNESAIDYKKNVVVNTGLEDIQFDFALTSNSGNDVTKSILNSLSFDYAQGKEKNALTTAKEWHWNISKVMELKEKKSLNNDYLNNNAALDFISFVLIRNETSTLNHALDILSDVSKIVKVNSEEEVLEKANSIVNRYFKI